MKRLFLPLLLLQAGFIMAQSGQPETGTSGTVLYEQVVKLEIKLEGDAAQFADRMPKERKSQKFLYFNAESSLFENKPEEEDQTLKSESGNTVMIRMKEPNNKVFTQLSENKQTEKREFMTREFLIESQLNPSEWKLTGQQKMVLNYPCQEAVRQPNDSTKIVAWFTPVIPIPSGPGEYLNLPGLVLSVDLDNGKHTLTAQSIEAVDITGKQLSKPKEGKKVSDAEFKKIVEDKMKEMGAQGNGSGTRMMIRIER